MDGKSVPHQYHQNLVYFDVSDGSYICLNFDRIPRLQWFDFAEFRLLYYDQLEHVRQAKLIT